MNYSPFQPTSLDYELCYNNFIILYFNSSKDLINLYRVTLLIKSYIVKGYRNKSALSRDLILTVITFASMAVLTLTTIYIGGI
jgi:hypothetical protein